MKRRELFKTVILTCLVISSVILASKIWFTEELWSDGYNSFSYKSAFFSKISSWFKREPSVKALDYNQIFFPKQLMLTQGETVILLNPADDNYNKISEDIKQILGKMFEDFSASEITPQELQKVCKTTSVFVDFYNNTSFKMLGDYFGVENSGETAEIANVRQLLISCEEPAVYARNNQSGKIYKVIFKGDVKELNEKVTSAAKSKGEGQKLYSYAFENGFDIAHEDPGAPKKMLLDSYIIVNINSESVPKIETYSLISERNTDLDASLLQIFDMSLNTSRPFSETDGTINYIENYAKLRINRNGLFEYDSMDSDKGIELGGGINSDYDIIKKTGEFLEKVNAINTLPQGNNYVFNRLEKKENRYELYFDLTFRGIPVILNRASGTESNVKIIVDGTRIISYKQNFIAGKNAGGKFEIKNMINALDDFYSVYDTGAVENVKISDMYNTYYYNPQTKDMSVIWVVALSNNEHVVLK